MTSQPSPSASSRGTGHLGRLRRDQLQARRLGRGHAGLVRQQGRSGRRHLEHDAAPVGQVEPGDGREPAAGQWDAPDDRGAAG
jgi:hypothetical protein